MQACHRGKLTAQAEVLDGVRVVSKLVSATGLEQSNPMVFTVSKHGSFQEECGGSLVLVNKDARDQNEGESGDDTSDWDFIERPPISVRWGYK